jgi:tetratricopeptide (TPR) repeat protein
MDPHIERAQVLIEQGRYELAEEQIRQALVHTPNDSHAHGMLAYCLCQRQQLKEALAEARMAVHLGPDQSHAHYIHAHVLDRMDNLKEAEASVRQAIAINPTEAAYHGKLAGLKLQQRQWQEALEASEAGLEHDAEHVLCNNLRAQALVKLGRRAEAGLTMDAVLARDPDNAYTHANQGWAMLERGDHRKAMEHFREALRLEPTMEWARAGIVEALKARNVVYRVMLKYFYLDVAAEQPGAVGGDDRRMVGNPTGARRGQ